MDSQTLNLIQSLRERVDQLVAAGNYDEALHAATVAVDNAQRALSPEFGRIDEFADALAIRGRLYRSLDRLDEACEDYKQAIEQLEERPECLPRVARLSVHQGAVYDALGNPELATKLWQNAIQIYENSAPPALLDVALISNNLAFLKKAGGDLDAAESYFLRALEIYYQELGAKHEETATVSNNIGAFYHKTGHFEQAREMHMMALEARRENFGEDHPDTAQSHNNLALALLETGDRSLARRHFEKSFRAFEELGEDFIQDLESVSFNYCDFLRGEGESALADRIEDRVKSKIRA